MSCRAILSPFVLFAVAAVASAQPRPTSPEVLRAFDTVKQVLQHPRCQNCHIVDDAPLQLDEGRLHAQYVQRGVDGRGLTGMTCSTCHGASNAPASYGPHAPPGAPNWHLPPAIPRWCSRGCRAASCVGCSRIARRREDATWRRSSSTSRTMRSSSGDGTPAASVSPCPSHTRSSSRSSRHGSRLEHRVPCRARGFTTRVLTGVLTRVPTGSG